MFSIYYSYCNPSDNLVSSEVMNSILSRMNLPQRADSPVNIKQFYELLGIRFSSTSYSPIVSSFTILDQSQKGYITLEDIRAFLPQLDNENILSIYSKLDVNHTGRITFHDYIKVTS